VLAVTVHSCTQINASEGSLNPFIRFYLDKAQELEKTAICENTSTPHWNETKFLLLNNLDSLLTMELRTTNSTKKAGKRLARANFNLKDIKNEQDLELDNLLVHYFLRNPSQKLTYHHTLGICQWNVMVNALQT
jgi:Ca2+-dependent lipid-binding protein